MSDGTPSAEGEILVWVLTGNPVLNPAFISMEITDKKKHTFIPIRMSESDLLFWPEQLSKKEFKHSYLISFAQDKPGFLI